MAADIEAFLSGRTVSAVDYTRWQLLRKFAQRHWRSLSAAAVVLVTILGALGYGIIIAQRQASFERSERAKTEAERQKAVAQEQEAQRERQVAQQEREQARANLDKAKQLGALQTIGSLQQRYQRQLGWTPLAHDGNELRGDLAHPPTAQRLAEAIATIDTWEAELASLRARQPAFRAALAVVPPVDANTPVDEQAWIKLQREIYHQILDGIRTLDEMQSNARQWRQACQARRRQPVDASLWAAASARIAANPRYRLGLRLGQASDLQAQVDLVPLGPDPSSGLEEFAHLGSGTMVTRDHGGRLILGETSGIVFVLIPAGRYWIGSARESEPLAQANEDPRHEVDLNAFLLAKHELTQAQWVELGGKNTSFFRAGQVIVSVRMTGRHPVEQVSWVECVELLGRHGLVLPTERQWEIAARGGRDTPWWTGTTAATLADAENVADASARRSVSGLGSTDSHEDGHPVTAPVGSFVRAHPLGMCDMVGNVREWCRDIYDEDAYGRLDLPLDRQGWRAAQPTADARLRVSRGGCWVGRAIGGRSAYRTGDAPGYRIYSLGCRPSRPIVFSIPD
jgi:formylglycine-generating enzyme required for sulfatase activity